MIFCVEDDRAIRDLMIYTLNASGFDARGMEDGAALFSALKQGLPELILLDIMLPGEDGVTILKKLRANPVTAEVPILMASARGTEYDKVIGLDLGAAVSVPGAPDEGTPSRCVFRRGGRQKNGGIRKLASRANAKMQSG